jgi:Tannase and feruloyl esterase
MVMGADRVERFAKLYLFPGVAHCGGGEGPNTFDILTPVMAWAETGTVPGKIIASTVTNGTVTRTRPVFPYPTVARYTGSGSTDDAANFTAYTPPTEPDTGYDWVGAPLYSPGYASWCRAEGTKLVCEGGRPHPWEQDGPTR